MAPPSIVVDGSAVDRRGWLRRPTPRLLRIGDSYQQFKPLELDRGVNRLQPCRYRISSEPTKVGKEPLPLNLTLEHAP
jgi:hypothetical protein